jgi:hypothetical protein
MRMHPLIRQAQHLVESGRIDEVTSVRAGLSIAVAYDPSHRLYDLEQGGGALLDLGIYLAYLAWMFLGRPSGTHASAAITRNQDVLEQRLPGKGYGPQITEVERCLAAGLTQSPLAPLRETVQILEISTRSAARSACATRPTKGNDAEAPARPARAVSSRGNSTWISRSRHRPPPRRSGTSSASMPSPSSRARANRDLRDDHRRPTLTRVSGHNDRAPG